MTETDQQARMLDASLENESEAPSPMVSISLREYDKLRERSRYITD